MFLVRFLQWFQRRPASPETQAASEVSPTEPNPATFGFIEGMKDFCAALIHPDHHEILTEELHVLIDAPFEAVENELSEAMPGGRMGPYLKGAPFLTPQATVLGDQRIDLNRLITEVLKLNAISFWERLFERLHLAQGGETWPPTTQELASPQTSVARMLRGYADERETGLDAPASTATWAAMSIHASNGKFFTTTTGLAVLCALFGSDIDAFEMDGVRKIGVHALMLDAIGDGTWPTTPADSPNQLVDRMHAMFWQPDRGRRSSASPSIWSVVDKGRGFGSCPAKRLSREIMNVFAQRIQDDPAAFIQRIRKPQTPSSHYEHRRAPDAGQVAGGPLAQFRLNS